MINSISFGAFKVSELKQRLKSKNNSVHIVPDYGKNAGESELAPTKILDEKFGKITVEGYDDRRQKVSKKYVCLFGVCPTHSLKESMEETEKLYGGNLTPAF